jgi:hypothetical protein
MNPSELTAGMDSWRTFAQTSHPPALNPTAKPSEEGSLAGLIDVVCDNNVHDWQHVWIDLGGES